jgi:hypothetical protein
MQDGTFWISVQLSLIDTENKQFRLLAEFKRDYYCDPGREIIHGQEKQKSENIPARGWMNTKMAPASLLKQD